jgi:methionyl-tRNA synthetase
MKKFYLTTPIYYVNAEPHLGGTYTTIAADVLARYHRMKGEDVFLLTGTDEHGAKIAEAAKAHNKTEREWCDENAAKYKLLWDELYISYNNFIRTTDLNHEKAVAKAVQKIYEKNLIYKGIYSGLYCVDCERYYTSKELVDGKCPYHLKELRPLSEECYFFKLSAFQKSLLKLIDTNEIIIEPKERKNEVLSFLGLETLEDLAISRSKVSWGIPLPWDDSQTIYVWIDALLNYLTGINWDPDLPIENFKYWPPDLQLIGKDILRFHAIIWPALLLALELPLPKKIFAHGFFTVNGQKMSKSLGNIINPTEMLKLFGSDATRYLLLSIFPFGQDGDISMEKFYEKYHADLANGIGNLVNRVFILALKVKKEYKLKTKDQKFEKNVKEIWENYEKAMENLAFEEAIKTVSDLVSFLDQYIDKEKPWQLVNSLDKFEEITYNLLENLRHLAWLIYPFMPNITQLIFEALNIKDFKKSLEEAKNWGNISKYQIKEIPILFPRIK